MTLFDKVVGMKSRARGSAYLARRDQPRPTLPLYRSTHAFVGDAPVHARTPELMKIYPQPLGLLPGGIRSVRLLLRNNKLTSDTRPNADVVIRNAFRTSSGRFSRSLTDTELRSGGPQTLNFVCGFSSKRSSRALTLAEKSISGFPTPPATSGASYAPCPVYCCSEVAFSPLDFCTEDGFAMRDVESLLADT